MRNKITIVIISLITLIYSTSCEYKSKELKVNDFDINEIEKAQNSGAIKEIKIQNQIWTKTNINISKLSDGRHIQYCRTCDELKDAFKKNVPAYCYLNFDIKNASLGKLYNYYVVFDSIGIAPKEWMIPTVKEFQTLVKAHGVITKNDMGQISYLFNKFSFKSPTYNTRNKVSVGFDAFLLGNTDSEYDCQFVEGVSDFWTKTQASSNPDDWGIREELKGWFYDARKAIITARFQDHTDENLKCISESFDLYPGANIKTLMPIRLVKVSDK
jgi:uncharacterized protein (TIGR02145 family)